MCYSAMVLQNFKDYSIKYGARIDLTLFEELFRLRSDGEKIKLTPALERNFTDPSSPQEKKIEKFISSYRSHVITETEQDLFAAKKRLADAERKLKVKPTKAAEKDQGIAERKIEACKLKLDRYRNDKVLKSDGRIYSQNFAPVIIMRDGERTIVPMRYHLRPMGADEEFDRKYPGCYNARRDSLTGFWKRQFGKNHAILIVSEFYENVKRHSYEKRKLKKGEEEENMVLRFSPKNHAQMIVPCIYDVNEFGNFTLNSFALITDEPAKEIAEAGHDRTPIFLKEKNIDTWLNPKGKSIEELFALLDDKETPYYEHEIAA